MSSAKKKQQKKQGDPISPPNSNFNKGPRGSRSRSGAGTPEGRSPGSAWGYSAYARIGLAYGAGADIWRRRYLKRVVLESVLETVALRYSGVTPHLTRGPSAIVRGILPAEFERLRLSKSRRMMAR